MNFTSFQLAIRISDQMLIFPLLIGITFFFDESMTLILLFRFVVLMTEEQSASFAPTSRGLASGEETQYGFSEDDIVVSEVEAPVISTCPG